MVVRRVDDRVQRGVHVGKEVDKQNFKYLSAPVWQTIKQLYSMQTYQRYDEIGTPTYTEYA
jgi:hypothetical protein